MSKNNAPQQDNTAYQEPRGTKRDRLDQDKGNSQAKKKSKGNEKLNNRLLEICKIPNPDIEEVRSLIAKGADVYATDALGRTSLHIAAEQKDNAEVIRILVEEVSTNLGVKVNQFVTTALVGAVQQKDNAVNIEALLARGADVEARWVILKKHLCT